jgi:hypothetical protein
MTYEEMKAEVDAICLALVEKGIPQPDVQLAIKANESPHVYMTHGGRGSLLAGDNYAFFRGKVPSECFEKAWIFARSLPDIKQAVAQEYTRKLADAVDFAVINVLPDEAVNPVRDAIRVVHDVLLPAPEVTA